MTWIRRYRHLVGFRIYSAEQPNDLTALQSYFSQPLPPPVVEFLTSLSDCLLYYRFDATTKTGKIKPYSQLLTTNIGPVPGEQTYQPASLIGFLRRYRERELPTHYLPLVNDSNKSAWLFVDVRQETGHPVVKHKDEMFFGGRTGWTTVAPDFETFVNGLQLDLKPLLSIFRIAGLGNIQEPMQEWLQATLGTDWQGHLENELRRKRSNRT